jgi:hypothetical protein
VPYPRKSAFDPGYRAIIDMLIERRREIGMSQVELAELYGEDQPFVSRVERRQRRLDVWEFVRWCRALGIEPGRLLASIEDMSEI